MILRLRPVLFLILIFLIPAAGFAQQRVKTKGPMYEDAAIIIYKNLFQVRLPVGFYAYSLAQKTFEKTHVPILIGARYERLLNSFMAVGGDLEYSYHNPLPKNLRDDRINWKTSDQLAYRDTPDKNSVIKFTPNIKFYIRTHKNRKRVFNGFFIAAGPSFVGTQVRNDLKTTYSRLNKPNGAAIYETKSMFAISIIPGFSHMFPSGLTVSTSAEVFFAPYQFNQEGLFKKDLGSGAVFLNPFRFYIGYRF